MFLARDFLTKKQETNIFLSKKSLRFEREPEIRNDYEALYWLNKRQNTDVKNFLNKYFDWSIHREIYREMLKAPLSSYRLVIQTDLDNDEKIDKILDDKTKKGQITHKVGEKGGGKTASEIGFFVPRMMQKGISVAIVGPPQEIPLFLNEHWSIKGKARIDHYYSIFDAPKGRHIVKDEGAITDNAKNHNDRIQRQNEDALPIMRHSDNSFTILTQGTKMVTKRNRDMADAYEFKPFSLMQLMKEDAHEEFPFPKIVERMLPHYQNQLMYISKGVGILLIEHDIYSFYKEAPDKWGKSFKPIIDEKTALEYAESLFDIGYTPDIVQHYLRLRRWNTWKLGWYETKAQELGLKFQKRTR